VNGTDVIGGGVLRVDPAPNWHAIETGSEGMPSDILFQTSIWEVAVNGTHVMGEGRLAPVRGPAASHRLRL
jgi:hypothetical protein